MRELAALRMVWASAAWMAVEILATCYMVREEAAGGARPSPYRVLSVGAREVRLARE
jgi:hypothetical protein